MAFGAFQSPKFDRYDELPVLTHFKHTLRPASREQALWPAPSTPLNWHASYRNRFGEADGCASCLNAAQSQTNPTA